MIDMQASNAKLRDRRIHMLAQATGADPDECRMALEGAGGEPKVALVTLLSSASVDQARRALGEADGYVRLALTLIS
jgi:N-acetylmuramic acid 6-phosphate etherase